MNSTPLTVSLKVQTIPNDYQDNEDCQWYLNPSGGIPDGQVSICLNKLEAMLSDYVVFDRQALRAIDNSAVQSDYSLCYFVHRYLNNT